MTGEVGQHGSGQGRLVVVATPIGNLGDLSRRAVEVLAEADVVYCEDTRHSGRLLEMAGVKAKRLASLHDHNEADRVHDVLRQLEHGHLIAMVSDAGTPLVSDPGARVVKAAIGAGYEVSAVPGPCAAVVGLVVSGLAGERWRYEGFLPRKGARRKVLLAEIGAAEHASVLYESPHRLLETVSDLAASCGEDRQVALARELTKLHEEIWRGRLGDAVERCSTTEARGEYVLVVDRCPPGRDGAEAELGDSIQALLDAGLARRDATIAAEVLLGASHRDAYQLALELASDRPKATSTEEMS